MPYAMEIGPIFSLLNDYVEEEAHMVQLLTDLRTPTVTGLGQTTFFAKVATRNPPVDPIAHIESDWFGFASGAYVQPVFDPQHPKQTGWWTRWNGDAAGITRETLVRALEVALGVPHASTIPVPTPTRCWRVQFIWTCGAPLFQGWVSWQWDEDDPTEGFVVVTFTTPGNGHPLYATPHRPATVPQPPDYEDPALTVGNYGMWVIGENQTEVLKPHGKHFHNLGVGVLPNWPNAFIHTFGGVTVVAPAEVDGGVLQDGEDW